MQNLYTHGCKWLGKHRKGTGDGVLEAYGGAIFAIQRAMVKMDFHSVRVSNKGWSDHLVSAQQHVYETT